MPLHNSFASLPVYCLLSTAYCLPPTLLHNAEVERHAQINVIALNSVGQRPETARDLQAAHREFVQLCIARGLGNANIGNRAVTQNSELHPGCRG